MFIFPTARFICPTKSDVLTIAESGVQLTITCEDGGFYSMPRADCAMLPIIHSTAEEMARYLAGRLCDELDASTLVARGIVTIEITIGETPKQEARYRCQLCAPPAASAGVCGLVGPGSATLAVPRSQAPP